MLASGAISRRKRPCGVTSMKASSVTMWSTTSTPVRGRVHFFRIFGLMVAGGVFHGDVDALRSCNEVHGAAHAFKHFAGDGPIGESSLFVDLERAEDGEIDVATANHSERIGGRKINGAGNFGDGFLASVDEVGIDFGFEGIRADAEHTVFGLEDDVHAAGDVIGDQSGHADAEIDGVAVAELECDAAGDAFAFLFVG